VNVQFFLCFVRRFVEERTQAHLALPAPHSSGTYLVDQCTAPVFLQPNPTVAEILSQMFAVGWIVRIGRAVWCLVEDQPGMQSIC